MMQRLTNRNHLKKLDWLSQVAQRDWREVEPLQADGLKIQQLDVAANLQMGLVIQYIKDAFENINPMLQDPPSRDERVGSDGQMAVAIHKALNGMTPREASDADLWAYLACMGCPRYVRWRWNTQDVAPLWTRFAGNIRRNALSRLWWWAEITHDPTKLIDNPQRYVVTKDVQNRQSLMLWFIDCAFSGHASIVYHLSALQKSHSLNDTEQKAVCRSVNRLARVVCLDSLPHSAEVEALCDRALQIGQLLAA
ncbi:MAG: hypothetical protein JWR19_2353 [Pedosphaera sp.]|nr:hypothetical protein [Pedosphaera sp.]